MEQEIMTIEEVSDYLKVNTRTVYRMLKAGELNGFKLRGQWRFKKQDIEKTISAGYSKKKYNAVSWPPALLAENTETVSVPLVGCAACGAPMLAEQNIEEYIPVSAKIAAPPYKYYLLRAKGDSMNLSGINDGDLVLVRQQNSASSSEIVVALVNDEATIKEYNAAGDMIILKPKSSNPAHKPIIATRDLVIQGVVVTAIPKI